MPSEISVLPPELISPRTTLLILINSVSYSSELATASARVITCGSGNTDAVGLPFNTALFN